VTVTPRAVDAGQADFRLSDVGTLRLGYLAPLPPRLETGKACYRALQLRDVQDDGSIDWSSVQLVNSVVDPSRHLLRNGDVLVPLRSTRISSVVMKDAPPNAIATGHWAVITPHVRVADPEFLVFYLRHPSTSARLAQLARGTSIQFISWNVLKDFEISLPSLEIQRKLARAYSLTGRVSGLEAEMSSARLNLLNAVMSQAISAASSQSNSKPNADK
jgi:hypothetical protein